MRVSAWEPLLAALVAMPLIWGAIATRPFETQRRPAVPMASATELLQRGLRAFNAGKPGEALVLWRRVLVLEPDWPASHNNMGMALMGVRRARDARPYFVRAVALAPGEQLFKNNLAWCERELAASASAGSAR